MSGNEALSLALVITKPWAKITMMQANAPYSTQGPSKNRAMPNACLTRFRSILLIGLLAAVSCSCSQDSGERPPRTIPLDVALSVAFEKTDVFTDSLLTMSFAWETGKTFSPLDKNLCVSVRFRDKGGNLLWETSYLPETPTTKWRPSQLVQYNRTLYVPPMMTEAAASVLVELYNMETSNTRYVISAPGGLPETPWLAQVGSLNIKPRPSMLASPSNANLIFESGFYPVEQDDKQEWRWTGKEARGKLQRLNERGLLFLSGEVNLQRLNKLPTITISLGGKVKARFSPDSDTGSFQRKLIVPDEDFGDSNWFDLAIEISEAFVPSKLTQSEDDRELGIKLMKIYFGPAGP